MRVVQDADALAGALEAAASEAHKAFGDAGVYLEKFIERPRHVEIQVLADDERTVHLGERECSIQRRHQKLVEEAPSVAVSTDLRERMGAAAVSAAQAVGYRGAGTCEFLLAGDGSFYFLEMNTRIQVEHPVTELVYGVDLVREQLRIAGGLPMRVHPGWLNPRGWALECRITSEDPANGFLPSTGRIEYLRAPAGPGVRWDSGVETGDEVTLYYDSLLAKLIVWAPDRAQAITRMTHALDELVVVGVATNQAFHRRLMADPAFQKGEIDIQFLERRADLLRPELSIPGAFSTSPWPRPWRKTTLAMPGVPLATAETGSSSEWASAGAARRAQVTEAVRILRLATGGDGVGKLADGKTVFVPRTAPGDLVELVELREHKRFARARPGRLVEASPDRVEPRCPHYADDECGGCQLQHLSYEAQLVGPAHFCGRRAPAAGEAGRA